jgi:hypothetical protein
MSKYKEIFLHKQDLLRNRPDKCRVETKADSHLIEDFRSHVKTRDFEVILDQPENMGSSDLGPRPSELLLAALAACHEVTYRLYADAMDIDLQDVAVPTRRGDERVLIALAHERRQLPLDPVGLPRDTPPHIRVEVRRIETEILGAKSHRAEA